MSKIDTELEAVDEVVSSCLKQIDDKAEEKELCGHCILTGSILQLLITALEFHGKEDIDEFIYKNLLPIYEEAKSEKIDKKKLN